MAIKRKKRVSPDNNQLIFLLIYMETHLFFAREQVTKLGKNGNTKFKTMWKKLSKKLNKIGTAKKDDVEWRNVWKNLKAKCRQKKINYLKSYKKTGNTKIKVKLDNFTERVCDIYGHDSLGLNLNSEIGLKQTSKMVKEKKDGKKDGKKPNKAQEKSLKQIEKKMKRIVDQPLTAQKGMITQYMIDNPDFAKRSLSPKAMKKHWKALKKLLNGAGPSRDLNKWKKSWSDKKQSLLTKWTQKQDFATQEDEELARILFEDNSSKGAQAKQVKKRANNSQTTTASKKRKLETGNVNNEDTEMQQALKLSAVQFAIDSLKAKGVKPGEANQKMLTPEIVLALLQSTSSFNLNSLMSGNVATSTPLLKDPAISNGASDIDQPSTSRQSAPPVADPLSTKEAYDNKEAGSSNIQDSADIESEDSDDYDDTSDDDDETENSDSSDSSDEEEGQENTNALTGVDGKNVFLHILAQQKDYNKKMLSLCGSFVEWCKQFTLPPPPPPQLPPTLLQDLRDALEGIRVQLMIHPELIQDQDPEAVVEGVMNENGIEDANEFVPEDPNTLKKYMP